MITKEQLISVANELIPQIIESEINVKIEVNSDYGTGEVGIVVWHFNDDYAIAQNKGKARYKSIYEFNDDTDLIIFLQEVENVLQGGMFNG